MFYDSAPRWWDTGPVQNAELVLFDHLRDHLLCFNLKKTTTTSLYLDWRARGIEQDWYVCYASLTWDSVLSWLQVKKLC